VFSPSRESLVGSSSSPPTETAGTQSPTILLTDFEGQVITWREVSGEPSFVACELTIVEGAVCLAVTSSRRWNEGGLTIYSGISIESTRRI